MKKFILGLFVATFSLTAIPAWSNPAEEATEQSEDVSDNSEQQETNEEIAAN